MYIEQYLSKQRHQELLKRAERERAAQRIVQFRKLERKRERAERELLEAWQRVDRLHSIMSTG